MANERSNTVSVLIGDGAGSFGPAVDFSVGSDPRLVAVGDFNGDGRADLAVPNQDSNNVSVLIGDGGGGFAPTVNVGVGIAPASVAVGDFDGDGRADLAVANSRSDTVSVLIGDGAGGFAPAATFGAGGSSSYSVAVGDFNGDGRADLAVANSTNVAVLIGDGAGALAPAVTFDAGLGGISVAAADLNGDGHPDLAVANQGSNDVSVLVNRGDAPTPPWVTINQAAGQPDPTSASPISFTAVFNEPATGFTGSDISFTGSTASGTLIATVTGGPTPYTVIGSPIIYNVAVTGMTTPGTVVASIPAGSAADPAGNQNLASTSTDNTVSWVPPDTTPPSVTINQAAGQPDPTSASPVSFTVVFSEPVTGFTGSDVSFTGSTAGGTLVAAVTGSDTTYDVAVTGMTTAGTVVASIPGGAATDSSANASLASTSTDNTVTFRRAFQSLPGVVTASTGWSLRSSLTAGAATAVFAYGIRPPALVPLSGDWDGDGTKTPGIFQAGEFKLRNTNSPGTPDVTFTFGDPRAFPVSGDFDGDGLDDVALYRDGTWQVRLTGTGATRTFIYGAGTWPSVVPVAGDWDGDGIDGIGLYCRDGITCPVGTWKLRNTAGAGAADAGTFTYNPGPGAYPVVGDWDADRDDTVAVRSGTTWMLNNANDSSAPEITFDFGGANDIPVVWARG